jgi:hypothetical protein
MPGPDSQSVPCKQASCFVRMQVGKQGKKEEGIANMFLFPRKYINILK